MKVTDVQLISDSKYISLKASCQITRSLTETIYYKFDKKYESFLYNDASPFAAGLLVPAMTQGEDLIIKGSISKQLYEGMQQIMKVMLSWNLGLKPIRIIVDTFSVDKQDAKESGMFFSGGVDSFYTYLKNKNSNSEKISYFILINGFDISLRNKDLWEAALKNIKQIAEREHIEIITVESNLRDLIEPISDWDYTHGGGLASVALSIRNRFKKIYIASTYKEDKQFPNGTHPSLDRFWSTEKITFIHDGAEASRLDKTIEIAKSPVALDSLRVCYKNITDFYNCGKCEKCLRTMISLKVAGVLEKTKVFPHEINIDQVNKILIKADDVAIYFKEILDELHRLNKEPELQKAISNLLSRKYGKEPYMSNFLKKLIYIDHVYNGKRLYDFYKGLSSK